MKIKISVWQTGLVLCLFLATFVACGPSTPKTETPAPVATQPSNETIQTPSAINTAEVPNSGYPGAAPAVVSAYPGQPQPTEEGALPEAPNPERDLPNPSSDLGVVGGVLVRQLTDSGFLPLTPSNLYLAEVLENNKGEKTLISFTKEASPKAELFATGIFIFKDLKPGTYGLVIDLGFDQFPVAGEDGNPLLVEVEPNKALDMGQVFVTLPEK